MGTSPLCPRLQDDCEEDHRLPSQDDVFQLFRIVLNPVLGGRESHIVQLAVIYEEMLIAVGMSSEMLCSDFVRVVRLLRGRNERDVLHSLKEVLVHQRIPMLVRSVGLQVLLVARLADDLQNAVFLGNFCGGAVPVVPGQVIIHDVANFVKRRRFKQDLRAASPENPQSH